MSGSTGTVRTLSTLMSQFADGQAAGTITPQYIRDLVVTLNNEPSTVLYAAAPEYGVKADGSTNDTAAWSTVLSAAATKGQIVIAPPGISMVSAISIPTGVTLMGSAPGANVYLGAATVGSIIRTISGSNTAPTITMNNGSNLRDLTVEGVGRQPGVQSGQMCRISDVSVYNATHGFYGNYGANASILFRCHANECTSSGIANFVDTHIISCIISSGANLGIWLDSGCNLCMIVGSRVEWSAQHNIYMSSCDNNTIVGCTIDRAGSNGIFLNGAHNICITGNNVGRSGKNQDGSSNNANDANFRLAACDACIISGNTTWTGADDGGTGYFSPYYAVYDGGTNTNCLINSNVLRWHANSTTSTGSAINTTATFNLATGLNVTAWSNATT